MPTSSDSSLDLRRHAAGHGQNLIGQRSARRLVERIRVLLDGLLHLRPETMAIEKSVRSVDLALQFIIALQEQLLHELFAIVGLFQRALQWQRIKGKPNLRGIAIDFMD